MNAANFKDGPMDLSSMGIREYEALFRQHYRWLCIQAHKIVDDWDDCEDIVQDFFIKCWQNRDSIRVRDSWKAFAARSIRNSALNYRKKEDTRSRHETASAGPEDVSSLPVSEEAGGTVGEEEERYLSLLQAIDNLPEQRRKAFLLSRRPDMKYTDIAEELGISVNTVKMHIRLAYQELRKLLSLLLFFF